MSNRLAQRPNPASERYHYVKASPPQSSSFLAAPSARLCVRVYCAARCVAGAPSFRECFDLEGRCGPAADLSGEKLEILLYPSQKGAEIRRVLHIRRVARHERRAVIAEVEDPLALAQQRMRQAALLFKRDAFRRQRDPFDEAEPGEDPRHMQRLQAFIHR